MLPGLLLEISICFPTSMTHRRMASWVVYFNKGMVSRPGCNRLWFRGLFLYMAWVLSIYKFILSHTFELSKIKSFNFLINKVLYRYILISGRPHLPSLLFFFSIFFLFSSLYSVVFIDSGFEIYFCALQCLSSFLTNIKITYLDILLAVP